MAAEDGVRFLIAFGVRATGEIERLKEGMGDLEARVDDVVGLAVPGADVEGKEWRLREEEEAVDG